MKEKEVTERIGKNWKERKRMEKERKKKRNGRKEMDEKVIWKEAWSTLFRTKNCVKRSILLRSIY